MILFALLSNFISTFIWRRLKKTGGGPRKESTIIIEVL